MKKTLIVSLLIFVFSGFDLNAQTTENKNLNLKDGLALQGYDPVAYFIDGKAKEGNKDIQFKHNDVTYLFSSAKNKALFEANPSKYEPAYGGWCAFAMASGEKVKIDPETFKIKDGKLLLFYNFYFNNTLKSWNKDEANLYKKAESEWKKITDNH